MPLSENVRHWLKQGAISAPSILSVTFDKPVYHLGDKITATVKYAGSSFVLTVQASDGAVGSMQGTFTVLPGWLAADTGSRAWTLQSDDGSTAVLTATA